MAENATLVHITHEAAAKVGGIGAVLHGFFTCRSYLEHVQRSIVIGPLFSTDGSVHDRLGPDSEVLYSSMDGMMKSGYTQAFRHIERHFNTAIVYGRRHFSDAHTGFKSSQEVILVDVTRMDTTAVNDLKRGMFEQFGIQSNRYEDLWEFEQYVRLAPVALAALKAIGAADDHTVIMAHEFMGLPTAFAAILDQSCDFKTIFYAHEVATMRYIVEKHPGHDTMFYNVIEAAHKERRYVTDVFGDQGSYFKHGLIEAARYCDAILAVGDYVEKEMRFLAPEFEHANIHIVYNGIPAYQIGLEEKIDSKNKLIQYSQSLIGMEPDYIFTHVTRLVASKGLWRDLRVLEHMETEFRAQHKTAVMFVLSTEVAQRRSSDIEHMEENYRWPVAHREGWPDLSGGEANFYTAVQEFNAKSRNIKVLFINQFGFTRTLCGRRMPADMAFMDIRKGTDVEFGQSIYEPFGIAQLEPLTFGGLCVVGNVCGCVGFVRDVSPGHDDIKNVIIADYTQLCNYPYQDIEDLVQMDRTVRDQVEDGVSDKIAMQICSRLTQDPVELTRLIENGYDLAEHMSWDAVFNQYVYPTLEQILTKQQKVYI